MSRLPDVEQRVGTAELLRRCSAEAIGTFALTAVAAGGKMTADLTAGQVDHVARALAPGLLVMAFIYALGDASGAHYNPGVTLAFTLKRIFPVRWVLPYWAAQFAGAIVAALVLRALLGDVGQLGATAPHIAAVPAAGFEIVLTWILVTVILGTADRYRLVGANAALAVGGTIALCGLIADPVTGASMNTARSLGPMIASSLLDPASAPRSLGDAWIYVVGPVIGAILAVITTRLLHGDLADRKTREAAQGDGARRK